MPTTTKRPAGTPTYDAFRARLQPELDVDQLDTRARNAAAIVTKALADGNIDLAVRGVARMVERWEQREALMPAPGWLWRQRHDTIAALFADAQDAPALAEPVTRQFYVTLCRASGWDAEAADAEAWRLTKRWMGSVEAVKAEELYA